MGKNLLKSAGTVSSMTMLSRIMGFVRDVVIAQLFGASAAIDAFFVAFKIPNFMRRLFAEGAFSQAFVPILSEYSKQRSKEEVRVFISHMTGVLATVLLLLTLLAEVSTPVLISVFAPGFLRDPERFALATEMLRITFPYLMYISLTALAGAILNTYGRFTIPAFTPVLLNVSLIGAALWLAPQLDMSVMALAWGVFIAGIVQLVFQMPFLWRLGLLPWPRCRWRDAGVLRVLKLIIPALFGVSVAQLGILLDTWFASFLPPGSVSWLYYSDRITSLPLGVFGVAIATVILPHLSKCHAVQSEKNYSIALDWGIRSVLLLGVPAAIALLVLGGPILVSLFHYGAFSENDVNMARQSLMAFALGVPSFMLVKVLASAFYAKQDIKTPVKIAVIALCANMALNVALIIPLRHAGLALATSIAAMLNAILLFISLYRRQIFTPQPKWLVFAGRLFIANSVLFLLLWFGSAHLTTWQQWSWQQRVSQLAILVTAGIMVYFFTLHLIGFVWRDLWPQERDI